MWMAYDDDGLGGGVDIADGVELLLSSLELWVAEHAKDRVFVHAGCAVHDGRAIVLPGRTMSGKYPRPLSIRPYDGIARVRLPVSDIRGAAESDAYPVGQAATEARAIAGMRGDDDEAARRLLDLLAD
jgi:hypothetical protein